MKPTLGFLLLTRDIIQDSLSSEITAVRIYDTLFILPGRNELIYPVSVVGRLYLNMEGMISDAQAKLKITDTDGDEMGDGQLLTGKNIQGNIGMNLVCRAWPLVFTKVGKYKLDVYLSTDGGASFNDVGSPLYFQVVKLT